MLNDKHRQFVARYQALMNAVHMLLSNFKTCATSHMPDSAKIELTQASLDHLCHAYNEVIACANDVVGPPPSKS